MATAAQSQVRSLARAVAAVIATAGLTDAERAPGQIVHTDLPWVVPPLFTGLMLGDASLQDYFDTATAITQDDLVNFWRLALRQTWNTPSQSQYGPTYALLRRPMRTQKLGVRAFRFATPAGMPGPLDAMTGVQLSLEAAHTAYISLPIRDLVNDASNYYVVLPDGTEIGVKDGRPAEASPWEFDASRMVQDLLRTERGVASYECQYDQIASVRSLIYVHRAKFKRDFDALDLALQALRVLSLGGHCPDLTTSMQVEPMLAADARQKERAVRECIELMADPNISDRSKLQTLRAELTPAVVSLSRYRREVYSGDLYPYTLLAAKQESICAWLQNYYDTEVPCSLRRTA